MYLGWLFLILLHREAITWPADLMNLFSYRHAAHHTTNLVLKSDHKNLLSVPNIRTGYKSIKYYCACLWNSFINKVVPIDANFDNKIILGNIKNIYQFKSKFETFSIFIYVGLTYFVFINAFFIFYFG